MGLCEILGYSEPGLAVRTHCKGGVKRTTPKQGGGLITIIPERDVYRLIMRAPCELLRSRPDEDEKADFHSVEVSSKGVKQGRNLQTLQGSDPDEKVACSMGTLGGAVKRSLPTAQAFEEWMRTSETSSAMMV